MLRSGFKCTYEQCSAVYSLEDTLKNHIRMTQYVNGTFIQVEDHLVNIPSVALGKGRFHVHLLPNYRVQ